MRIAPNVEMLELPFDMMGQKSMLNVAMIWDENDVVLVDTGLPDNTELIKEAMEAAGIPFSRLNKVIITHHDMDHLGGLPGILEASGQIEVMAHEAEIPYIDGTDDLVVKIEKSLAFLPPDQQQARIDSYKNRQTAKVNTVLTDGQELPVCGGITVIHTPGHTPGHICLYVRKAKTLIAGDGTVAADGKLTGPNPVFTIDVEQAVSSLKKLLKYDIEQVICYHGGVVQGDIQSQITALQQIPRG